MFWENKQKAQNPSHPIPHIQKIILSYGDYETAMKQKTIPTFKTWYLRTFFFSLIVMH